jgi:hypothetical protein
MITGNYARHVILGGGGRDSNFAVVGDRARASERVAMAKRDASPDGGRRSQFLVLNSKNKFFENIFFSQILGIKICADAKIQVEQAKNKFVKNKLYL